MAVAYRRPQLHHDGMWIKAKNEELLKTHPHLVEFLPFLDAMNSESSRGAVLIAASYLDNMLYQIIEAYLIEGKPRDQLLSGFNAPLSSLSAKIAMAAALGLLNEVERRECDVVRRIRNKFAHQVHPSFEHDDIANLCGELQMNAKPYGDIKFSAKGAYTSAVVCLISNLHNRAVYAGRDSLKPRSWPQ